MHEVLRLIGGGAQVELTEPRDAVTAEGARVEIVSLSAGKLRRLLMPGGTVNADTLRVDPPCSASCGTSSRPASRSA